MPNKKELQSALQESRTDNRFTDHDKKSAHFLLLHAAAPSGLFIIKNPKDRLSEQGKSPFRFRLAGLSESNALSADRAVDLCRCTGKNVNGLCHDLRRHLLPYGWLYQSKSYYFFSLVIPITVL